ncbi:MAG TPA: FAD-dependent oxidoreductase [Thermodesulfobacteriota bacterium]|nr:FAD-dependent oxidoreductase [Thermodesulfobacteriota bacterium]
MSTSKLRYLFDPLRIGAMHVKNRLVMAPMGTNLASLEGKVTPSLVSYYQARARGGVGLIITDDTTITSSAIYHPHGLRLDQDPLIQSWKELTQAVHVYGAKIAPQLVHPSFNAPSVFSGVQPVAASPIPSRRFREIPRELTVEEIKEIVRQFGEASRRAQEAECDAVQIHCAHMHHLLGGFLSPLYNKRTDTYGGSLEGRLRLPLEVIQHIRSKVGPGFPILVRISGDEFLPGGQSLEESKQIASLLVEGGVDAIQVSAGTGNNFWVVVPPTGSPEAPNAFLAEQIKKEVNVPIICVGRIHHPWAAENLLKSGKADMVAMGRALVADPELPNKAARGDWDEIAPCVGDSMCLTYVQMEERIRCLVNPMAGREEEDPIPPAAIAKNVLVIGGGPAGMEAARVAAMRGHRVTLIERASKLGGQLLVASFPPMKQEYTCLIQYLSHQVKKAGVKVELNREADLALVSSLRPETIIVATGAVPFIPRDIPGFNRECVLTAWEVLAGRSLVGPKVVVVGGGKVGCETADFIAHPADDLTPKGNQVTIIELQENIALDEKSMARSLLIRRLKEKGVGIILGGKVIEILPDGVKYVKEGREEALRGMNHVVLAIGAVSENTWAQRITGIPTFVIGDAKHPRNALESIAEGWEIGRKI